MNEPKKFPMFWSILWSFVGIGLFAFTSLMSFGNALIPGITVGMVGLLVAAVVLSQSRA